jgi:isoquinoline 1-oxidoreductase subunit alpha
MENIKTYTFSINNKQVSLDLPEDIPLLWILRDHLQLTGTKFSCGIGQCGACTVLIDNQAVFSCQLTAEEINGKNITTIEGISSNGLHPVQQAWLDNEVSQCGYCQSGQILTAISLFTQNPAPDKDEINRVMSKVLCRCGTYTRIKKAISQLINTTQINKS